MPQRYDPPGRRRWGAVEWAAPRTDPIRMTVRARILVVVVAGRNFLLGAALFLAPGRFSSSSYGVIRTVPWAVWAVAMVTVGVVCIAASITMDELTARVGVGAAGTLSLVWSVGTLAAALTDHTASPAGPIVWASLTAKDFLICSYPMASPFEPLIRRVAASLGLDSSDYPGGGRR